MTKNSDRPLTLDDLDRHVRDAFTRSVRSWLVRRVAYPELRLQLNEWNDHYAWLSKINVGQVARTYGRSTTATMRFLRSHHLLTEHKHIGRAGTVRSIEFSLRRDLLDMIAAEVTQQALAKGLKIGEAVTI